MKQTVTLSQFRDEFHIMNRQYQFSYDGLRVLFEYLERYEEDTGQEIELDVIALCCDYTEANPWDIATSYGIDLTGVDPDEAEEVEDVVLDYLNDHTTVCGVTDSGTIVYQQF